MKTTQLISRSGTESTGITSHFVTYIENESPKGSYTVQFSTTFSNAKDPDAHHIKYQVQVADTDGVKKLGAFLSLDF